MEYWRLKVAKLQAKIALKEFEKPLICWSTDMTTDADRYGIKEQAKNPMEINLDKMISNLHVMQIELNKVPMNSGNMIAIIEGKSEIERAIRKIKIISANT